MVITSMLKHRFRLYESVESVFVRKATLHDGSAVVNAADFVLRRRVFESPRFQMFNQLSKSNLNSNRIIC